MSPLVENPFDIEDTRTKTRTCVFHCSGCGLHFSSLSAFEGHRKGDYASSDPLEGRHCEHPIDLLDKDGEPLYAQISEDGECRMRVEPILGVTVWTLAKNLENAGEYWATRKEQAL